MPRLPNQGGAAAVEMAFTLLLLLWMAFGVIDIGRAIFTDIGLKEAAQASAHHFAFTEGADGASAATVGANSTTTPSLVPGDFDVECHPITRSSIPYGTVTVTATHDLDLITPIVGAALGGSLELTETAEAERYFSCP